MPPWNKTAEFLALQKEWYEKLEKDEFEDIEPNENTLKHWALNAQNRIGGLGGRDLIEYQDMAKEFLETYKFDTELDYIIWTYHVEGLDLGEITEILQKANIYEAIEQYNSREGRRARPLSHTKIRKNFINVRINTLKKIMLKNAY